MKKLILLTLATVMSFTVYSNGPEYASETTKEIIGKMIEAHGGYEKWSNMKTLSFSTAMHSESLGFLRFWINDQTVDMKSRRTYQDWPLFGSKLAFDGERVWSIDWRVGNPPSHQQSVFFYYLNLPWLTQDDHVMLGEAELIKHKAFDNEVYKVLMSYKEVPTVGKSEKDIYTLFIDAKTFLLVGYEYVMAYGPILDVIGLPKDQGFFGPMLRKNNYFGDVNGLKFPMLFTTHSADYTEQYGDHAIYNIQINGEFDESRMQPPANAVFDPSKDIRK
tara:strand:- start:131 stop:958 length:828 start_codon:yes stop_codon:yes gene_type:complete